MGVFRADGTRVVKSAFPTVAPAKVPLQVTQDLFVTSDFESRASTRPEGDKTQLLYRTGATVFQGDIDALYPPATVTSISPVNGPLAGGTVVTINGTNLDGVTAVTFGGTPGTTLTVVSNKQIRVTSPAKAAGAAAVVVVDDSGNVAAGNFTYA